MYNKERKEKRTIEAIAMEAKKGVNKYLNACLITGHEWIFSNKWVCCCYVCDYYALISISAINVRNS